MREGELKMHACLMYQFITVCCFKNCQFGFNFLHDGRALHTEVLTWNVGEEYNMIKGDIFDDGKCETK